MKYIFILIVALLVTSCEPVRYVDVQSRHNYYQRHRSNTYTTPVFIPGRGIVLQTYIVPIPRPARRGRH